MPEVISSVENGILCVFTAVFSFWFVVAFSRWLKLQLGWSPDNALVGGLSGTVVLFSSLGVWTWWYKGEPTMVTGAQFAVAVVWLLLLLIYLWKRRWKRKLQRVWGRVKERAGRLVVVPVPSPAS